MQTSTHSIISTGIHSYVDTAPESSEKPIVLLHGMVGDVRNWSHTIEELANRSMRVIVPVLPVYSIAKSEAHMAGLVSYLASFFDALHIKPCTLGGNSMGGQLAVLFAIAHPERVERLVLSGASGITEVDLGSSIMRRKDKVYLRDRIEKTFFDPVHCTDALVEEVIEIINTRENAVRLIKFARSVQRDSILPFLSDIDVPTLIIWGLQDQITPVSVAHTLDTRIANSTLILFPKCGHAPMMEHPQKFNEALLDFLPSSELVSAPPALG